MEFEIKTNEDIYYTYIDHEHIGGGCWTKKINKPKKLWVALEDIEAIENKSLESTGLDLCGYSQDDVWERAIRWIKEEIEASLIKG